MKNDATAELHEILSAPLPENRAAFARFLQIAPALDRSPEIRLFKNAADESDFSQSDWANAAAIFQKKLETQKRFAGFSKKLGYLCCCAGALAGMPPELRPALARHVEAMLDEFGFSG